MVVVGEYLVEVDPVPDPHAEHPAGGPLFGRGEPGRGVDQLEAVIQVLLKVGAQPEQRHLDDRFPVRRTLFPLRGGPVHVGQVRRP